MSDPERTSEKQPSPTVVVTLTFAMPAVGLDHVVGFLRDLDALGVNWDAEMDSHPTAEVLAKLPPRVRIQAG